MMSPSPWLTLPENRFAQATIFSVIKPGADRVSAFVYGPSGVGKSHLVSHALGHFRSENPEAIVWHLSSSEFAAQFAESSVERSIPRFQAVTRRVDVLALEDLQSLEGRFETQTQLVAIVDHLVARRGAILWTSRKSPGELASFLPRLVSRFRSAVLAPLDALSGNSRERLVQHFAAEQNVQILEEAVATLAQHMPVSPRELRSMVRRLGELARNHRQVVDSDLVRNFVAQELPPSLLQLDDVCRSVAREFGVAVTGLRSKRRHRSLVVARQCAMLLAREFTSNSVSQIGRYFSGRDHSTVVHACQRISRLAQSDSHIESLLNQVRRAIAAQVGQRRCE